MRYCLFMDNGRYKCDLLILGAGIIGFSIGISYLQKFPAKRVVIAEKERSLGVHASGRNSGVLHAGFYYSPDSLKAKFCRDGNFQLKKLIKKWEIPVREVGKVVVARNDIENEQLDKLFSRGIQNGVDLELMDENFLIEFEPLAKTTHRFIWSPTTSVSDPKMLLTALQSEFQNLGGKIDFNSFVHLGVKSGEVYDRSNKYNPSLIVNAAGAQADRISRQINVGLDYAMLPFMGVYRVAQRNQLPLQRLVYPVPHPVNPFLGVHFTLTVDGLVKVGPTAIPILGREQYSINEGWSIPDVIQAFKASSALMKGTSHDLGAIFKSEWPKIFLSQLIEESAELVPNARKVQKWAKKPPGIRAQLVHLPTGKLEQDFVVKDYLNSIHVLNAVSPGWTSALPLGKWITDTYLG